MGLGVWKILIVEAGLSQIALIRKSFEIKRGGWFRSRKKRQGTKVWKGGSEKRGKSWDWRAGGGAEYVQKVLRNWFQCVQSKLLFLLSSKSSWKPRLPIGGTSGGEPACQCRRQMQVWSLHQEDPLEEDLATHSRILVWRTPMDRGAWQVTGHRVAESQTWLRQLSKHGLPLLVQWFLSVLSFRGPGFNPWLGTEDPTSCTVWSKN